MNIETYLYCGKVLSQIYRLNPSEEIGKSHLFGLDNGFIPDIECRLSELDVDVKKMSDNHTEVENQLLKVTDVKESIDFSGCKAITSAPVCLNDINDARGCLSSYVDDDRELTLERIKADLEAKGILKEKAEKILTYLNYDGHYEHILPKLRLTE